MDVMAQKYRALLLDPCNGPLVPPTAVGPTTGLLFRQKKIISLSDALWNYTSVGASKSFAAVYRPALGQVVVMATHDEASTNVGTGACWLVSLEDGILSSARSYRAVAGCIKFLPTGAIGSRTGIIGTAYVPDTVQTVAANTASTSTVVSGYVDKYLQMTQHIMSNSSGPESAEVRWIPSDPADLEFRDSGVTYNADTGGCLIVGKKIDPYSTGCSINGFLEVTTVFEWIPAYDAGVVSSIQMGSTTSLQTVLSTLGDLGKAATDNAYVRQLLGAAIRGTGAVLMGAISNRIFDYRNGPSLLTAH
jgi:hypothetical protein